jgi:L-histidine N-alpha-methyltransferase
MSKIAAPPAIDVLLGLNDRRELLERDVREGLSSTPKRLATKWHYDEEGSRLFSAITELPEYYLTRRERAILEERAGEIAAASGADTLVELGAGTSTKTRLLLDAFRDRGSLARIVLLDVDEGTLRSSAARLADEYPGVEVHGVVGDIERHLAALPRDGRRMIAFLGSSIGNLSHAERSTFLPALRATMAPGETFLLGTDLVKDPARLVAAYDDAAGVTRRFSLNVLNVLNRELAGNFDLERFRHVPRWDAAEEQIDVRLRSLADQRVRFEALDFEVDFADGEELHTEISAKFRRTGVEQELAAAGLELREWWTDRDADFALSLSAAA